jgi:hypothetical protein
MNTSIVEIDDTTVTIKSLLNIEPEIFILSNLAWR